VVAPPPKISTSIVTVVPLPLSTSIVVPPQPPTSSATSSLASVVPIPSSSSLAPLAPVQTVPPVISVPKISSSLLPVPPVQTEPPAVSIPKYSNSSRPVATRRSSSFVVAPPRLPSSRSSSATVIHTSVPTTIVAPLVPTNSTTVKSTILVFARDDASAYSAYSGLNAMGIPYELLIVPQAGITLPVLNTSMTAGNYGGFVILSEVSYNYGASLGFQSALSAAQWASLYQYQLDFGARMVRMDAFPGPVFGTRALGGCCNSTVEQLISISDISKFPTSGIQV